MATIEDIWTSVFPEGTQLQAAGNLVSRTVSWVLVLRPRPPGLEAPRGDEIILLSTQTLHALDPHLTLARAIEALAGKSSGVAVRGEVPPDACEEAERLGIPLFQLPDSVSLTALQGEIIKFLTEQRTEWYRRKHSILQDLTALAVQGRGLPVIAQHMCEVSGHAVIFEDDRGEVLASYIPRSFSPRHAEIIRTWGDRDTPPARNLGKPALVTDGLGRLAAPVIVKSTEAGAVSLFGPMESLTDDTRLVLEAGATAGAIESSRESAVQETVHRIQGDFVSELVTGAGDTPDLERRARRMGYDLEATRVAIAFCPIPQHVNGSHSVQDVLANLGKRLVRVLPSYEVQAPFHIDEDSLVVFYPLTEEPAAADLQRLGERLRRDLSDAGRHHRLYVGISRSHSGIDGFRTGFKEARQAVEVGRALAPDRFITYFGDLGVYRLLFAMHEKGEMQEFYNDMLGRLVQYDQEKKKDLVPTLEAYLTANNATEVAARLTLHRNTLLYRLRRVREITGLDLDDPETRLALHLALRIGETLRAATASGS